MELACDKELSVEQIFKCLVKVRETAHVDVLNCFKRDESLESLSREELEKKLLKSLSVDTEEVSRVFGKPFDRIELVRLAHYAIEEANNGAVEGLKRKADQEPAKAPKKTKGTTDTPAVSVYMYIFSKSLFRCIYDIGGLSVLVADLIKAGFRVT